MNQSITDFFVWLLDSTCENALWNCTEITNTTKVEVPNICTEREVFTNCTSLCPVTCENIGAPPTCLPPAADDCTPGCICKEGYVWNGKDCVPRLECPCYHGGKPYQEGEKYYQECNEW